MFQELNKTTFILYLDLEQSKEKLAAFITKHPEFQEGIEALKIGILTNPASDKYNNPEDAADFYIAEFLELNVQQLLENGQRVSIDSVQNSPFPHQFKEESQLLFEAVLTKLNNDLTDLDLLSIVSRSYSKGIGVEEDPVQAFNYFKLAADQGNAAGQHSLGSCYETGTGVEQDFAQAVKYYRLAAYQGNTKAQCNLGSCYLEGDGVEKNPVKALNYFKFAADQGNAKGQHNVGYCYVHGVGVGEDPVQAFNYYKLAADQGLAIGQYIIGTSYLQGTGVEQDSVQAFNYFKLAADQGNVKGQRVLGSCYLRGTGVEEDPVQAFNYFKLAADQGDVKGQYVLGSFYLEGTGVEEDPVQASNYFRLAADQGNVNGQYVIGSFYLEGTGVEQDFVQAFNYFRLSADQGLAKGQDSLGFCYLRGIGVEQDFVQAVRYYRLAADQGDSRGQCNLGFCYLEGIGIDQDFIQAVKYYRLAADQGFVKAQNDLKTLLDNGFTDLMFAAGSGDIETTKNLLKDEACINDTYSDITALEFAAINNHPETLNAIVTIVADMQIREGEDWREFQTQLNNPQVQNLLSKPTVTLLATILPRSKEFLIESIITNFSERNPDKLLTEQESSNIDQFRELKDQKKQQLTASDCFLENHAVESSLIKDLMLVVNPQKQDQLRELAIKLQILSGRNSLTQNINIASYHDSNEEIELNQNEIDILSNPDSLKYSLCRFQLENSIKETLEIKDPAQNEVQTLQSLALETATIDLMNQVSSRLPSSSSTPVTATSLMDNSLDVCHIS